MTLTDSNRIGLILTALLAAACLFLSSTAHACGGTKGGGCGCNKPPVGIELPPGYVQPKAHCNMGGDKKDANGKPAGCGCGGGAKVKKLEKGARAGYPI